MWISTWRLSEVQTFINLSWWDNIIYHFIRLLHSQWIRSWTTREREITKTRKIEKTLLIITYQWNWSENRIISFFIRWDRIKLMWRVTFLGIQTPSAAIEASYRGKIQLKKVTSYIEVKDVTEVGFQLFSNLRFRNSKHLQIT